MSVGPKPNCPWRKPPRHPLDHAEKIAHVIGGALFGGLASLYHTIAAFFAVSISEQGTLWIPAGILLAGMSLGSLLAAVLGRRFIDWIEAHYTSFWRSHGNTAD